MIHNFAVAPIGGGDRDMSCAAKITENRLRMHLRGVLQPQMPILLCKSADRIFAIWTTFRMHIHAEK
jgi:hypothetical protein